MITPDVASRIHRASYVPEHLVPLMTAVSGGEPFSQDGFVFYARDDWVIAVGYRLDAPATEAFLHQFVQGLRRRFRPRRLWVVWEQVPRALRTRCRIAQEDVYYRIGLDAFRIPPRLERSIGRAAETLSVHRESRFSEEHERLMEAFLAGKGPPPLIQAFYRRMPALVETSPTAFLLDARDREGRLQAFQVVEEAASSFDCYVVGCRALDGGVPHASDLLMYGLVQGAIAKGKPLVQLGLGVNAGIRRFKEKWGGRPFLRYTSCLFSSPWQGLLEGLGDAAGRV